MVSPSILVFCKAKENRAVWRVFKSQMTCGEQGNRGFPPSLRSDEKGGGGLVIPSKVCFGLVLLCLALGPFPWLGAQTLNEEKPWEKQSTMPRSIDFSKMFEEKEIERQDYEKIKQQKQAKLKELMSQPAAIEKVVDPETYLVGPGDVFSFNIWGALEMQIPVMVNPEGHLLLPSIGEVRVAGRPLKVVQEEVSERAKAYYKVPVTLSLEALRFFRVHVVGEVKYPGTYPAMATQRISDLITEAGGVTDGADKTRIVLRREGGDSATFDLTRFESLGEMTGNRFLEGGDVIYVPPLDLARPHVTVEGDFRIGGLYPIEPGEDLKGFLNRIQALNRNTELPKVMVIRQEASGDRKWLVRPFESEAEPFALQDRDRIILPSSFVYVKGAVRNPGAYPYIRKLTAKDYAGMAGGDFQAANIQHVKVFDPYSGKVKHGPDVLVEPGNVVDLPKSWGLRFTDYMSVLSTLISLILAAKAIGLFEK